MICNNEKEGEQLPKHHYSWSFEHCNLVIIWGWVYGLKGSIPGWKVSIQRLKTPHPFHLVILSTLTTCCNKKEGWQRARMTLLSFQGSNRKCRDSQWLCRLWHNCDSSTQLRKCHCLVIGSKWYVIWQCYLFQAIRRFYMAWKY